MLRNGLFGMFFGKFIVGVVVVFVGAFPGVDEPDWLLIGAAGLALVSGFVTLWLRMGTVHRARLDGYRTARADARKRSRRGSGGNIRSLH